MNKVIVKEPDILRLISYFLLGLTCYLKRKVFSFFWWLTHFQSNHDLIFIRIDHGRRSSCQFKARALSFSGRRMPGDSIGYLALLSHGDSVRLTFSLALALEKKRGVLIWTTTPYSNFEAKDYNKIEVNLFWLNPDRWMPLSLTFLLMKSPSPFSRLTSPLSKRGKPRPWRRSWSHFALQRDIKSVCIKKSSFSLLISRGRRK